ncbi:uncharacterized protein LOC117172848 [Belonocnema kinseyi]|uniref:uncharacterized protein LOC117172848 n=1 Tax=Belonocnema kinseyi TaxID=2817044 RepID=UPI00143DFABD|nr:uncharacterized protein LOC117172848 [Belonocnema kinseyi]
MADIGKMFRQILVDARDCNYQRILWCSPDNNVVAYRLLTLAYNTTCALHLANKVIKQLAHDQGIQAKEKRQQVSQLLESSGFHLRKWVPNDSELLEDCPSEKHERAIEFPLAEAAQLKDLGLFCDPESVAFHFKVTPPSVKTPTKSIVLSLIAKLYDSMGCLTPVMLVAMLLMQELWLPKLDWDKKLPNDLQILWSDYHNTLEKLESLKVPRLTGQLPENLNYELHGFAYASSKAYSTSVYLNILSGDLNNYHISLLKAESKVVPLKYLLIPRLE